MVHVGFTTPHATPKGSACIRQPYMQAYMQKYMHTYMQTCLQTYIQTLLCPLPSLIYIPNEDAKFTRTVAKPPDTIVFSNFAFCRSHWG